jgi:hypothetical protein
LKDSVEERKENYRMMSRNDHEVTYKAGSVGTLPGPTSVEQKIAMSLKHDLSLADK